MTLVALAPLAVKISPALTVLSVGLQPYFVDRRAGR